MNRDPQQSEGRRRNAAVPAWEITKGVGRKGPKPSEPGPANVLEPKNGKTPTS